MNNSLLFRVLKFYFILSFILNKDCLAKETLILGSGISTQNPLWPKIQKYVELISLHANSSTHIAVRSIPFKRLTEMVLDGQLDGDLGREEGVYNDESGLVQVPEPIAEIEFVILTHMNVDADDMLKVRQSKTVVDFGDDIHKEICKKLDLDCIFVTQGSDRFAMVRSGRAGSMLTGKAEAHELVKKDVSTKIKVSRTAYKVPIYIFLSRKQVKMVPHLNSAIRKVKQDGHHKALFDIEP
ncbi:MAG TPA: hypothetical protein VE954_32145 [Oligoflexus sp.]|uniref:hypothetical protein n=1 Tax=Oligoflexus sp. TaxID=1971216 RepID=UPI002D69D08F|nr:hypothetical protein [Oligoflexus sp.]HYX37778.1 hypothetical protein [Oligoflexus sp.]